MQLRRFFALCALVTCLRCGTVVDHHNVTLAVSDPGHRLASPVEGALVERTSSEALEADVMKRLTSLPLTGEVSATRVVAGLSSSAAPSVDLAFVIPKLAADGFFLATLAPDETQEKRTEAKLVHFAEYFPDEGAMTLPLRYSGKSTGRGWTLNVTVEVPAP
jgi:hypothetical protein